MKFFSIYLNQNYDLEKAKFVSDGFSFKAFIFSYFWALYHKLWLFLGVLISFEALIIIGLACGILNLSVVGYVHTILSIYSGITAHRWLQLKYCNCFAIQKTIIAENELKAQITLFENLAQHS